MDRKSIIICIVMVVMLAGVSLAETAWVNAVDGNWGDNTKWSAGMPDGNHAYLTNLVSSYTVSVTGDPDPFTVLTMENAPGQSVTLDVDADMDFASPFTLYMEEGNAIHVREDAALRFHIINSIRGDITVHTGALFRITTQTGTRGFTGRITVKSGGTWLCEPSFQLRGEDATGGPAAEVLIEEGGNWNIESGAVYIPFNVDSRLGVVITNRGAIAYTPSSGSFRLGVQGGQRVVDDEEIWHQLFQESPGTFSISHHGSELLVGGTTSTRAGRGRFTLLGGSVTNQGRLFIGTMVGSEHLTINRLGEGEVVIEAGEWLQARDDRPVVVGGVPGDSAGHATMRLSHTNNILGRILQSGGTFRSHSDLWVANGPSSGLVSLSGGEMFVTNAAGTASMLLGTRLGAHVPPAPGIATLNLSGGTLTLDRLVATSVVDNVSRSIVEFEGGTLTAREVDVENGNVFVVGDGTTPATLHLRTGILPHRFADGVTVPVLGVLSGTAIMNTPFLNITGGTLLPGGSGATGVLSVEGDVTLTGGAVLRIGLAGAEDHGLLEINGSVALGGTLETDLLDDYVPAPGSIFTILTATGDITGSFDAANLPAGFTVIIDDGNVLLGPPRGTLLLIR